MAESPPPGNCTEKPYFVAPAGRVPRPTAAAAHALSTAGCCWVMQWIPPPPTTMSLAETCRTS